MKWETTLHSRRFQQPAKVEHLSIDFSECGFREAGARAVADRIPADVTQLSLDFARCNIGEGGARAVAERVHAISPAGVRQDHGEDIWVVAG